MSDEWDLVDDADISEPTLEQKQALYVRCPWLDPTHPLYFPSTLDDAVHHGNTRWDHINVFSIEAWYPCLKEQTFFTEFVPIPRETARALLNRGGGVNLSDIQQDQDDVLVADLIQRIDQALANFSNPSFLRLSTRSPKDSTWLFPFAARQMAGDVIHWPDTENVQQQLVSFVSSMLHLCCVDNGKEAVDLVLGSQRVFNDLLMLNATMPEESPPPLNVVLREVFPLRLDLEFRAFVSQGIVTGLSQYFHFLHFDACPSHSEVEPLSRVSEEDLFILRDALVGYITGVIEPLLHQNHEARLSSGWSDYIIDLALVPLPSAGPPPMYECKRLVRFQNQMFILYVVELNPFAPSATGAMLFNWEADLHFLWKGRDGDFFACPASPPCPPPCRVRRSPIALEALSRVTLLPYGYESVLKEAISIRANA